MEITNVLFAEKLSRSLEKFSVGSRIASVLLSGIFQWRTSIRMPSMRPKLPKPAAS
jgi:hypothetical protein